MNAAHPTATVTVWAEDEHRLGLLPVLRRVWAPRGQRPVASVRRKYEWLYVYGFVRPSSGQSWWCLLPTVNAEAMSLALAAFAHDLVLPAGIDLVLLPAQSPELQPAERLWALVDEPVANRAFADLDALETVLVDRCRTLAADPTRLKTHTHFHWWPSEPSSACRQ